MKILITLLITISCSFLYADTGIENKEHQPIEGVVNGIFAALRTSPASAREQLALELFSLGPAAETCVLDYIDDNDKSVVITSMKYLAFIQSERGRLKIHGLTIHPNWEIRAMAVVSLGAFNADDSVKRIADVLKLDDDLRVREAAAYALYMVDNPQVIDIFLDVIVDSTGPVKDAALRAFQKALERQSYADGIIKAYRGKGDSLPEFLRLEMLNRLGNMADRRTINFFAEVLESPIHEERAMAAKALGLIGDTRAIDILQQYSMDPSAVVREHVKNSLIRITGFRQWNDKAARSEWNRLHAETLLKAVRYELLVEQAITDGPEGYESVCNAIRVLNHELGDTEIFANMLTRCLMSRNSATVEFAMYVFGRFPHELQPSLKYIFMQGTTRKLLMDQDLFRACELASLICYRYRLMQNIPLMLEYTAYLQSLRKHEDLVLRRPLVYLCLRGMTGVELGEIPARWGRWWLKNRKRFMTADQP